MSRASRSVLLIDGSDRVARIAAALDGDGRDVVVEERASEAATAAETSGAECVVYGDGAADPLEGIASLRSARPTVPIVLLLSGDESPAAALEAGATDCLRPTGEPDEWAPLLANRVDAAIERRRSADPDAYRSALESALGDETALLCLFDEAGRHVVAAGASLDPVLDPPALEGAAISSLDLERAVRARLEAMYVAASDGDSRSRELLVDGRLYRVETRPATANTGYGLARYVPAAATAHAADGSTREKIERLHDIAAELDTVDDEAAICRLTIESVSRVLDFDASMIGEVEDDEIVPLAATDESPYAGAERRRVGEGIAGRTYRDGETIVVDDVREEPTASPTDPRFRSVLSIPVGEFGVFQAVSTEVGAYSDSDRELGELLVAHAVHAIERVRYERAITRERDQFAALFQNIPDAAIKYVFDGEAPRIDAANSAFARLFGYEPAEIVGESTLEVLIPDDEREAARSLYAEIREGDRLDRQVDRRTVDGTAPFLLRSVPVTADGDAQRGYLIYTDVSELIERERELERQNERLDAFASIVSHDLRNPLSVADSYLEAAVDTGQLELLEVVDEEHDRMRRMIEDLLALARQGEAIGETEAVDLESVVRSAWSGLDTEDATIAVDALPTVEGDPARLQQLFENLFRNAVLHGGDGVAVDVGTLDGGVYVGDDGPGVPDDLKDEILEMGVSTAKGEGGTGYGLAIVTEIAAAHGWDVQVTDHETGGARFELVPEPESDDGDASPQEGNSDDGDASPREGDREGADARSDDGGG